MNLRAIQMLDYFVATGGNFSDIANVYSTTVGSRETEEILKRWLRMQRCEDIIIATKVCGPKGGGRERYFTEYDTTLLTTKVKTPSSNYRDVVARLA